VQNAAASHSQFRESDSFALRCYGFGQSLKELGPERVVAFGNGNNDRKMLKIARVGIAVSEGEGCAVDALMAADAHVMSAKDSLDLLLKKKRLKATLRF